MHLIHKHSLPYCIHISKPLNIISKKAWARFPPISRVRCFLKTELPKNIHACPSVFVNQSCHLHFLQYHLKFCNRFIRIYLAPVQPLRKVNTVYILFSPLVSILIERRPRGSHYVHYQSAILSTIAIQLQGVPRELYAVPL